jgi:hypothetical protein
LRETIEFPQIVNDEVLVGFTIEMDGWERAVILRFGGRFEIMSLKMKIWG